MQIGYPYYGDRSHRTRTSIGRVEDHLLTANKVALNVKKSESVSIVFKILQQRPSWVSLNLVLEEIAFEKGVSLNALHTTGLITQNQTSAFKQAANNARDINQGPRHGNNLHREPSHPSMSLPDAVSLVQNVIHDWFDSLPNS